MTVRPEFTRVRPAVPPGVRRCPCCCWQPGDPDHPLGLCPECRVCLHCESAPTAGGNGLCAACAGNFSIRVLYRRGRKFDPAWEQHLRRLTRWYQQQLAGRERPDPPKAAGA